MINSVIKETNLNIAGGCVWELKHVMKMVCMTLDVFITVGVLDWPQSIVCKAVEQARMS